MAERFVGAAMNASAQSRERPVQTPGSPSLDSDILSGSALPSSLIEFDGDGSGWVLFSPQVSVANEHADVGPLQEEPFDIEPLDLSHSTATEIGMASAEIPMADMPVQSSTEHTQDEIQDGLQTGAQSGTLELPTHNGRGTFDTPCSRRLDLFERVNAWRMEQSEILTSDLEGRRPAPSSKLSRSSTLWQRVKRSTVQNIGRCIDWDDQTIDALFCKDFGIDYRQEEKENRNAEAFSGHARRHFATAQQYGPPDWQNRILNNTLYRNVDGPASVQTSSGFFIAMLSRFLIWSRAVDDYSARRHVGDQPRRSAVYALFDQADHSYHMDTIQSSIATVSSTMTAVPWSDTWDTGTSTSLGVAAA